LRLTVDREEPMCTVRSGEVVELVILREDDTAPLRI
jgi:hypothetical protein